MLEIMLSAIFVRKVWNKFLILCLIILFFYSQKLSATPGKVEVWFLSETAVKSSWLPDPRYFIFFDQYVQNSFDSNCIPMGEGCFHPQYGMMEADNSYGGIEGPHESKVKTINSLETEVMNCDKNYYFDLYCGKALSHVVQKEGMELWVDNSGSFKSIDLPRPGDICYRQSFAEKLRNACEGRVSFSSFNTSIKPISDLSVICNNVGGNDTMRIIRWISNSEAKELIMITDVSEYNDKLEVYLNSIGAQIKGIGTKPFYARDLDSHLAEVKSKCAQKK